MATGNAIVVAGPVVHHRGQLPHFPFKVACVVSAHEGNAKAKGTSDRAEQE